MEAAFDELLNTTVVISTAGPASRDVWGVETYSTAPGTTYRARYVERRGEVRGNNGETIVQHGLVWIDSTGNLSTAAKVYVTQVGRAFPIAAIERYPDEHGPHHVKLTLGY